MWWLKVPKIELLGPDDPIGKEKIGFETNLHVIQRYYNWVSTFVRLDSERIRMQIRTLNTLYDMMSPYIDEDKIKIALKKDRKNIKSINVRNKALRPKLEDFIENYYIDLMEAMACKGLLFEESAYYEPDD